MNLRLYYDEFEREAGCAMVHTIPSCGFFNTYIVTGTNGLLVTDVGSMGAAKQRRTTKLVTQEAIYGKYFEKGFLFFDLIAHDHFAELRGCY